MFGIYGQPMSTSDPTNIYAWQRINSGLTTSGGLMEGDIDGLANIGVAHVIDLAPASHESALQDERGKLAQHGIGHTLIEVPFNNPTEEHYQQFKRVFDATPRPIHVHCIYNYRASAFLYRYHLERGMPESEARALMMEHWSPDKSDHPAAQPWKRFIKETTLRHIDQTAPRLQVVSG